MVEFDRTLPFDKNMKKKMNKEDYKKYSQYHADKKYKAKQKPKFCEFCNKLIAKNTFIHHSKTKKHILQLELFKFKNN